MVRHKQDELTIPPDGRPMSEQPQWRQDFPIDWPQDELVARRDFTKFMVLTSLAFATGQVWILAQNALRKRRGAPPIMPITPIADIEIGQTIVFNYPGPHDPALLIRTGENTFVAYDQRCTHLACAVRPDPTGDRINCPCHNAFFDLHSGRPISGPPRRPLTRITLELRNGTIYATGVELRTV
jgi:Rieske Fe-S protein